MASSIFLETDTSHRLNEFSCNANLVVVFGKSGINFDRKGLQKLIDDRTLSSISVIRLTSDLKSCDFSCDNNLDCNISINSNDKVCDAKNGGPDYDGRYEIAKTANETFKENLTLNSEIVSISVEEFYATEKANIVAHEILNLAGVAPKRNIDCEFLLYVIQNDHCYTSHISSNISRAHDNYLKTKICNPIQIDKEVDNGDVAAEETNTLESIKDTDTEDSPKRRKISTSPKNDINIVQSNTSMFDSSQTYLNKCDRNADVQLNIIDKKRKLHFAHLKYVDNKKNKGSFNEVKPDENISHPVHKIEISTPIKSTTSSSLIFTNKEGQINSQPEANFAQITANTFSVPSKTIPSKIHYAQEFGKVTNVCSTASSDIRHKECLGEESLISTLSPVLVTTLESKNLAVTKLQLQHQHEKYPDINTDFKAADKHYTNLNILKETTIETISPSIPQILPRNAHKNFNSIERNHILKTITEKPMPDNQSITELVPTFKSSGSIRNEPVKIIRGNGRVITLPPIEAPTTRAKRKALAKPLTDDESLQEVNISLVDEGINPNGSNDVNTKRPKESNRLIRNPIPNEISNRKPQKYVKMIDKEDENDDDDDDPKRLWCICRTPHNNRFMICCDVCEDWFHGTCVNVTKTMGLEMEQKGVDWTCPKCIERQLNQKQRKITDLFIRMGTNSAQVNSFDMNLAKPSKPDIKPSPENEHVYKDSSVHEFGGNKSNDLVIDSKEDHSIVQKKSCKNYTELQKCIVCNKICLRGNSVYCSDDCLKKYAITTTQNIQSILMKSTYNSDITSEEKKKRRNFEELLNMIDRPRKLERVTVLDRKTGHLITGSGAPTLAAFKKWLQDNPSYEAILPNNESDVEFKKTSTKSLKCNTRNREEVHIKQEICNVKVNDETEIVKTQMLNKNEDKKSKQSYKGFPNYKNEEKHNTLKNVRMSSKPIRLNVQRTLKEQLVLRINEISHSDLNTSRKKYILTNEEVTQFVNDTEEEMFNLFNRDTGYKYKAKYRSLIFNIKDKKNKTLLEKICAKSVCPKELVRMSPEELASQELSQWRENEAKHQLEIIKKTELDSLTYAKNHFVKTHKGEVIIETVPAKQLDKIVEELALPIPKKSISTDSVLKNQKSKDHFVPHTNVKMKGDTSFPLNMNKDNDNLKRESRRTEARRSEKTRTEYSSKECNKNLYSMNKPDIFDIKDDFVSNGCIEKRVNKIPEICNLVDQIIDSTKSIEEAANIEKDATCLNNFVAESNKVNTKERNHREYIPKDDDKNDSQHMKFLLFNHDNIIWTGNINMIDVASFEISLIKVTSNSDNIAKEVPTELDIVGRITPDTVWDYIYKIKKSPNRDIVIISLLPAKDSEASAYHTLYEYLKKRDRLGVIKSTSAYVKDFYIYPLQSGTRLPAIIDLGKDTEAFEDCNRPDLMIGIIIRKIKMQFPYTGSKQALCVGTSNSSLNFCKSVPNIDIDAIIKGPIGVKKNNSKNLNDLDEPYSPGEESNEEANIKPRAGSNKPRSEDLQRKMDELNRQIAVQEMEIAGLLSVDATNFHAEATTSSDVLNKISLPSNLSQLLENINIQPENRPSILTSTDLFIVEKEKGEKVHSNSRLSTLSEAELLRMVPDVLPD